uniref:Ionotropic glutamate receptor C-terminal domain-containing protein n=1 Tax=Anopheles minimus TaxID=112268 RepID=A0A182W7T8_9DIPT
MLSTLSLLERILLEANSIPIETYTFVATDEPFFRAVIDGLAGRCNTLMVPMFNNAVPLYVPNRQLVVVGADNINTTMLRWQLITIRAEATVELMQWFNKQLENGEIHIILDRSFRADLNSVSHVLPEMNGACLVIPKTQKYKVLQHLLRPLQATSWIALTVMLLVGSYLANRYFKNSLPATLMFGADLNSSTISRTERTVLFASLLVFFILSEAYQAKLLALMSSCRYPPDPKTVAEFLQTDIMLHLGAATGTVVSFRQGFKRHVRNATDHRFSFDGGQTYGILLKCPFAWDLYVRWINQQYDRYGYNVRPQVHIVREKILSLPAAYTFSRNFLLYPRFKQYLSQIFESGLVGHWQTEQDRQRQYEQKLEFVENEIITFNDLVMVWTVLGIGFTMALVVFLIEFSFITMKQQATHYW